MSISIFVPGKNIVSYGLYLWLKCAFSEIENTWYAINIFKFGFVKREKFLVNFKIIITHYL